jgi:hypothetical protein
MPPVQTSNAYLDYIPRVVGEWEIKPENLASVDIMTEAERLLLVEPVWTATQ